MGYPSIPTKQDLLREAMAKAALATSMDRYAEELASVFKAIPTSPEASNAFWKGPAADRYITRARQLEQEIRKLEEACTATARNLRRKAEQLRKAAAQSPDAW
ncbi:WXG100 family type VII secretion target [Nonomuraea angiospora]|uniref:WXG100 family type VII secretion target n=1 Tax=Nonomuraea angiospora TaxID=46172 RepID=UPI00344EF341